MENEDDDYELQIALALSLAEGEGHDTEQLMSMAQQMAAGHAPPAVNQAAPPPTPAAAAQQPQAAAPAPAAVAGQAAQGPSAQMDLAAALAAALSAGITGGQLPGVAPQQQQQQQQQLAALAGQLGSQLQQQQQGQQVAHPPQLPRASSRPGGTAFQIPGWATHLSNWWGQQPSAASSPAAAAGESSGGPVSAGEPQQVEVALAEWAPALQVVGSCLGVPVIGAGAAAAQGAAGASIRLNSTPSGSSVLVKPADVEALLVNWMVRQGASAGMGGSQLQLIRGAYDLVAKASSSVGAEGGVGGLLSLLADRLCQRVQRQLGDDEDDLFFESGRHHSDMLTALRSAATMSPGFLSGLATSINSSQQADAWEKLLGESLKGFSAYQFTGGLLGLEQLLVSLDLLSSQAPFQQLMLSKLASEVASAAATASRPSVTGPGKALQNDSLLGPLLGLGTFPEPLQLLHRGRVVSRATEVFTSLRGYPGNTGETAAARSLLEGCVDRLQVATEQLVKRLLKFKAPGMPAAAGRELIMSWLAAVAAANEVRTAGGEYSALQHLQKGADDNFMLNCCALLFRLGQPFTKGYLQRSPKFADLFSSHLSPSYYTTQQRRLGSAPGGPTLSGQRGLVSEGGAGSSGSSSGGKDGGQGVKPWYARQLLVEDPGAAGQVSSFMADVFFMTQRHVHVGLMPTVHRYFKLMDVIQEQAAAAGAAGSGLAKDNPMQQQLALFADCAVAQLMHPEFAAQAVEFVVLELLWMSHLLTSGQGSTFALIPEHVLADATAWLSFVVQGGHAEMLAALDVGCLMRSLVVLLQHPEEVRSLLVVHKLVRLLLVMLAPQIDVQRRTIGGALGRTMMRPGEAALVAALLGASVTQEQLVPALMRCYGQADFVVGLDVDKDAFDKFNLRNDIDKLLLELWRDAQCRKCIQQQALSSSKGPTPRGTAAGLEEQQQQQQGMDTSNGSSSSSSSGRLFDLFVSAVLNDLIYLFKDSLERLADIKQIELSKADAKAWAAMSEAERGDKERFYQGQQRTARGYMSYAITTLTLLTTLTGDEVVVRPFLQQPLLGRAAYALLHFLELLVGSRCQQLQVKDPQQYFFDTTSLLLSLVQMVVQLGRYQEFLEAIPQEPDYEQGVLEKAIALLNEKHHYAAADGLEECMQRIALTPAGGRAAKRRRGPTQSTPGVEQPMEVDEGAAAGNASAAAAARSGTGGGLGSSLEALVDSWKLPGPQTYEEAQELYVAALQELAMGVFDATRPGSYNSAFVQMAEAAEGDTQQKMRKLGREMRDLRGKTKLPIHAAASHFVRHDAERMDKVRAIITGPEGTPYEAGLFVFDLYFPAGYPNVPPLMVLETTGEGRVRFNPNLYADGKVCLSLLGTWHGGDASSKWNPASSSLYQILLSIQGMILVGDPYFNEPNVELMRGKAEGVVSSKRYNAELRLGTLRWAMVAYLKAPPAGFEEVVKAHFRSLRGVIMSRMGRWLCEAAEVDPSTYERMVATCQELHQLLAEL